MNLSTFLIIYAISLFGRVVSIDCNPPWQFSYGSSCYMYGLNPHLTWGEARIECLGHGGYLAIVDNAAEEKAIATYHNKHHYGGLWYWIGGTDFGTEGEWHWDYTGKHISNATYTNWFTNGHVEPNGKWNENCLMVLGGSSKWNDLFCDYVEAYLCEKN